MSQIVSQQDIIAALGLDEDAATATEKRLISLVHPAAEAACRRVLGYNPCRATRTEYYPAEDESNAWGVEEGGRWDASKTVAFYEARGAGSADSLLCLKHMPVRSITNVWENPNARAGFVAGDFGDEWALAVGTDYYLDIDQDGLSRSGLVRRVNGHWSMQPRSVKVEYVAGWTPEEFMGFNDLDPDPASIRQAVVITAVSYFKDLIAHRKNENAGFVAGQLQSESLDLYRYTVSTDVANRVGSFSFEAGAPPEQALELLEPHEQLCLSSI